MTRKVLLIDDDPAIARTLQMLLRTRGWDADVVLTGTEGIAAATNPRADYALALVDFRLPDQTGFEVLQHLAEQVPSMLRVLISGYGPEEFAGDPRAHLATAMFRKPVPLDALCALLNEAPEESP